MRTCIKSMKGTYVSLHMQQDMQATRITKYARDMRFTLNYTVISLACCCFLAHPWFLRNVKPWFKPVAIDQRKQPRYSIYHPILTNILIYVNLYKALNSAVISSWLWLRLRKIESTWNEKQKSDDDDDTDIDDDYDDDVDDLDVYEQLKSISFLHLYIQLLQPDNNEDFDWVERGHDLKIINLLKGHRYSTVTAVLQNTNRHIRLHKLPQSSR